MKYYIFETEFMGRFAVEASSYEEAIDIMTQKDSDILFPDEEYVFVDEATIEEIDLEGLDVF